MAIENCFLVVDTAVNQVLKFKMIDKKIYVRVVTLSTLDNVKLVLD